MPRRALALPLLRLGCRNLRRSRTRIKSLHRHRTSSHSDSAMDLKSPLTNALYTPAAGLDARLKHPRFQLCWHWAVRLASKAPTEDVGSNYHIQYKVQAVRVQEEYNQCTLVFVKLFNDCYHLHRPIEITSSRYRTIHRKSPTSPCPISSHRAC